jgi:hypothetical protein
MLDYTKVALNKTVDDVKKVSHIFTIILQSCYIAYLIFAIVVGRGMPVVNATLLAIACAYLIFYIVTAKKVTKSAKSARKTTKRIYKIVKLTVNAFTLVVALYSIFITNKVLTSVSLAGILVTVFMLIGWLIQTALMVISIYLDKKVTFLLDGFMIDLERITKPFDKATNLVKKIKGEPIEPKKYEISDSNRKLLDDLVEKAKIDKKERIATLKAEYKAQKQALKLAKRQKSTGLDDKKED